MRKFNGMCVHRFPCPPVSKSIFGVQRICRIPPFAYPFQIERVGTGLGHLFRSIGVLYGMCRTLKVVSIGMAIKVTRVGEPIKMWLGSCFWLPKHLETIIMENGARVTQRIDRIAYSFKQLIIYTFNCCSTLFPSNRVQRSFPFVQFFIPILHQRPKSN